VNQGDPLHTVVEAVSAVAAENFVVRELCKGLL
jgi:hypothetical protein